MTQYMLSVHHADDAPEPAPEDMQRIFKQVDVLNEEMQQAGAWVFGGGLQPSTTATVVRERGGSVVTTDGPYIETKEQLGGFWILECENLDVALDWAKKATVACANPVEVRPFQEDAG